MRQPSSKTSLAYLILATTERLCFPQNPCVETHPTKVMIQLGRWGLWEVIGLEIGVLKKGRSALMSKIPLSSIGPSSTDNRARKRSCYEPASRLSPGNKCSCNTTMKKMFLLSYKAAGLWYFAAQCPTVLQPHGLQPNRLHSQRRLLCVSHSVASDSL